jgi:hypothetical protein
VTDLPGDMTHSSRRLAKPLGYGSLVENLDRVVAGKCDLLDGKFQARHDSFSLVGNASTNLTGLLNSVLNGRGGKSVSLILSEAAD